jgi:hypothetical protein
MRKELEELEGQQEDLPIYYLAEAVEEVMESLIHKPQVLGEELEGQVEGLSFSLEQQ